MKEHEVEWRSLNRRPAPSRISRSAGDLSSAAIVQTLKRADGNKVKAATALGTASTLYEKMRRYRIA